MSSIQGHTIDPATQLNRHSSFCTAHVIIKIVKSMLQCCNNGLGKWYVDGVVHHIMVAIYWIKVYIPLTASDFAYLAALRPMASKVSSVRHGENENNSRL